MSSETQVSASARHSHTEAAAVNPAPNDRTAPPLRDTRFAERRAPPCYAILARAMSQQNVEVVRRFFGAIERFFEEYWKEPRSVVSAVKADDLWPAYRDAMSCAHPDAEWQTIFLGSTHQGALEIARAGRPGCHLPPFLGSRPRERSRARGGARNTRRPIARWQDHRSPRVPDAGGSPRRDWAVGVGDVAGA